jgi:hypothetical protein
LTFLSTDGVASNSGRESINTVNRAAEPDTLRDGEQSTGNVRVLESLSGCVIKAALSPRSAQEISGGSRAIPRRMNELVEITQRIKDSMDEIGSGTGEDQ